MNRIAFTVLVGSVALASCDDGAQEVTELVTSVDIAEPVSGEGSFSGGPGTTAPPPPPPPPPVDSSVGAEDANAASAAPPPMTVPVAAPQIAYRFDYGFRVPKAAIQPLQERHVDMCEARGPNICRVISMEQSDDDGDYAYGALALAVAADTARDFGKSLAEVSGQMDGELSSSSIQGEDLSKKIVDTEARLRARSLLRDRLMEILRNREGTVAELVEAERGVAQVNEEIDQARSWLAEMRGRVAFTQMQIRYEAGSRNTGSFVKPIRDAWGSIGGLLGGLIAFLIIAVTVLVPLGLVVWLLVTLFRRTVGRGGWLPKSSLKRREAAAEETP